MVGRNRFFHLTIKANPPIHTSRLVVAFDAFFSYKLAAQSIIALANIVSSAVIAKPASYFAAKER